MLKTAIKRGLIIALVLVPIACIGGIAPLDLPIILIIDVLVTLLGIASYLSHNKKGD